MAILLSPHPHMSPQVVPPMGPHWCPASAQRIILVFYYFVEKRLRHETARRDAIPLVFL